MAGSAEVRTATHLQLCCCCLAADAMCQACWPLNIQLKIVLAIQSYVGMQELEDDAPVIILLPGLTGGSHDTYVRCGRAAFCLTVR